MSEDNHEKKQKVLAIAFNTIKPLKGAYKTWIISGIIGIILSVPLGISPETVAAFDNSIEIINNILLAFVAMVMGAYALFQALLSDELIVLMSEKKNNINESVLDELNSSFLGTVLLYWIYIIFNCVLLIIMKIIPEDYTIYNNIIVCDLLAIFLMLLYYIFAFRGIIEFKNFTINIYNLFRAYNLIGLLHKKK